MFRRSKPRMKTATRLTANLKSLGHDGRHATQSRLGSRSKRQQTRCGKRKADNYSVSVSSENTAFAQEMNYFDRALGSEVPSTLTDKEVFAAVDAEFSLSSLLDDGLRNNLDCTVSPPAQKYPR